MIMYTKPKDLSALTGMQKGDNSDDPIISENDLLKCQDKSVNECIDKVLEIFPFVCGLCDNKFNRFLPYYEHLKAHDTLSLDTFHVCAESEESELDAAEGEDLYYCRICNASFVTICLLHYHVLKEEKLDVYVYEDNSKCVRRYEIKQDLGSMEEKLFKNEFNSENKDTELNSCEQVLNVDGIYKHVTGSLTDNTGSVSSDSEKTVELNHSDYKKTFPKCKKNLSKMCNNKKAIKGFKQSHKSYKNKIKMLSSNRSDKKKKRPVTVCSDTKCETYSLVPEQDTDECMKCVKVKLRSRDQRYQEKCDGDKIGQRFEELNPEGIQLAGSIVTDIKIKQEDILITTVDLEDIDHDDNVGFSESIAKHKKENNTRKGRKSYKLKEDNRDQFGNRISSSKVLVPCDICGKMYKKCNMRKHVECHTETRNCICDICDKGYKTKAQLTLHKTYHTVERNFICRFCGKDFNTKANLRQHEKTHTAQRDLQCPSCPGKFTSRNILRKHMRLHSDTKPYVCDVCGQSFKTNDYLKRHLYCHTDNRPFSCPTCNKAFKGAHDLRKHKRIHEPFTIFCSFCNKGFVNRTNMRIHERIHTKVT